MISATYGNFRTFEIEGVAPELVDFGNYVEVSKGPDRRSYAWGMVSRVNGKERA